MNKRIKELAKEAGINLTPAQFSGVLEDEVSEFELENFAQLVAEECMEICKETQDNYRKQRAATDDFSTKNIFAQGESACAKIRYEMIKKFDIK